MSCHYFGWEPSWMVIDMMGIVVVEGGSNDYGIVIWSREVLVW